MEKRDLNFKSFLIIPLIHVSLFVLFYLIFSFFGIITEFPTNDSILRWDASWYNSIMKNGYQYFWYEASNSAFFPLFPYLWKLLHVNAIWISLINYLICLFGLYLLFKHFEIEKKIILVFLAIPSSIFFFLPYTESLFLLCTSIFLVGLKNDNLKWIVVGIFLSSLTRATAMFFIPSIIIMEVFFANQLMDKKVWKNILLYSLVSLIGLFVVVLFQYALTAEWFAFAKQQVKFWHHRFSLPGIPFVTYGGSSILWLDALALNFGFIASLLLVVFGVRFLLKKSIFNFKDKPFWFSATYAFMVTVYCIFFDHKSYEGGTELVSLNRYLLSTSFFLVFLNGLIQRISYSFKNGLILFSIILFSSILLGLGRSLLFLDALYQNYHRSTIFFIVIMLYFFMYYFLMHPRYKREVSVMLLCINLILSVIVYHLFIQNNWVA
jgi:hypothetical protein